MFVRAVFSGIWLLIHQ